MKEIQWFQSMENSLIMMPKSFKIVTGMINNKLGGSTTCLSGSGYNQSGSGYNQSGSTSLDYIDNIDFLKPPLTELKTPPSEHY